ncbi:hypothetical protein GVAV_001063 [Gurleya vavrai]
MQNSFSSLKIFSFQFLFFTFVKNEYYTSESIAKHFYNAALEQYATDLPHFEKSKKYECLIIKCHRKEEDIFPFVFDLMFEMQKDVFSKKCYMLKTFYCSLYKPEFDKKYQFDFFKALDICKKKAKLEKRKDFYFYETVKSYFYKIKNNLFDFKKDEIYNPEILFNIIQNGDLSLKDLKLINKRILNIIDYNIDRNFAYFFYIFEHAHFEKIKQILNNVKFNNIKIEQIDPTILKYYFAPHLNLQKINTNANYINQKKFFEHSDKNTNKFLQSYKKICLKIENIFYSLKIEKFCQKLNTNLENIKEYFVVNTIELKINNQNYIFEVIIIKYYLKNDLCVNSKILKVKYILCLKNESLSQIISSCFFIKVTTKLDDNIENFLTDLYLKSLESQKEMKSRVLQIINIVNSQMYADDLNFNFYEAISSFVTNTYKTPFFFAKNISFYSTSEFNYSTFVDKIEKTLKIVDGKMIYTFFTYREKYDLSRFITQNNEMVLGDYLHEIQEISLEKAKFFF